MTSNKTNLLIVVILLSYFALGCKHSTLNKREGLPKLLIIHKTAGFKHPSIQYGILAIQKLGVENKFEVDTTSNAALFTEENLQKYSAVVFLSTTGNVLNNKQEAVFERYIQSGGGYVGIHAASDTEYDWKWYGRLVGAYFVNHPKPQKANFHIKDFDHPATRFFKDSLWVRKDELYNFKEINPNIHDGRNAMAGPNYHAEFFRGKSNIPSYYNGKTFVYDWMRGGMKAISFFDSGDFRKSEPFASDIKLNNLIDMELAPNGRLYLLEYGRGWYSKNDDAALSYVSYNPGNRAPKVSKINIDKLSGKVPLNISASVIAKDLEGDSLQYLWHFGDGKIVRSTKPNISYTYNQKGVFQLTVTVSDFKGGKTKTDNQEIVVGNSAPKVAIEILEGNTSFLIPEKPIKYKVKVTDQEDGQNIDLSKVYVSVDFLESFDEAQKSIGHQTVSSIAKGKNLINDLDCKGCYKITKISSGPSYQSIVNKYKNDAGDKSYLSKKISKGGAGIWGEATMPAHPNISNPDLQYIVDYIMSLNKQSVIKKSLPLAGTITPDKEDAQKTMVLKASYVDGGNGNIRALSSSSALVLKSNIIGMGNVASSKGFSPMKYDGNDLLIVAPETCYFELDNIDIQGINVATLMIGWQQAPTYSLYFELRAGASDGQLIGEGSLPVPNQNAKVGFAPIQLKNIQDKKTDKLFVIYKHKETNKIAS